MSGGENASDVSNDSEVALFYKPGEYTIKYETEYTTMQIITLSLPLPVALGLGDWHAWHWLSAWQQQQHCLLGVFYLSYSPYLVMHFTRMRWTRCINDECLLQKVHAVTVWLPILAHHATAVIQLSVVAVTHSVSLLFHFSTCVCLLPCIYYHSQSDQTVIHNYRPFHTGPPQRIYRDVSCSALHYSSRLVGADRLQNFSKTATP